ncbi:AzlC family ABC transporter permease [Pseudomonas stutzeri]|uniref:AzlC family ABC transporter permease n=1 Tax=Stutzerimonas stutzeri TaxID=316 RepID=UPI00210CE63B|nr:AzlC family ABC transporter permease [Stutzerimonas stutzeri]MCQ4313281.1 AzlC family ABC transporter permease [Stutzerimonas stutzeri]
MEATAYHPFDALRRVAPAALAVIPVSLLFGVLAGRSDWSPLEVAMIGLLGFTGSGQFAVLPLADSGAGFVTMLLLTASINSRYLPIAYVSASGLPQSWGLRALLAHMLGDEAYATEREQDSWTSLAVIRGSLFTTWVIAGVAGALIGSLIPAAWIDAELNLGFPASVVLMYLSISQLRARLPLLGDGKARLLLAVMLCALIAVLLILLLGPLYFWVPSVLLATLVLSRVRP